MHLLKLLNISLKLFLAEGYVVFLRSNDFFDESPIISKSILFKLT